MDVEFTHSFAGQDHDCSYSVAKGMMSVRTPWGTKSIQLGELPAHSLARLAAVQLAGESIVERLRAE